MTTVYLVRRVCDGLMYKGPMHKNHFVAPPGGKQYKTRVQAQRLIDDFAVYKAVNNGLLEIMELHLIGGTTKA